MFIVQRLTNLFGGILFFGIGGYFSYTNYESQHYAMMAIAAVSGVVFAITCLVFALKE